MTKKTEWVLTAAKSYPQDFRRCKLDEWVVKARLRRDSWGLTTCYESCPNKMHSSWTVNAVKVQNLKIPVIPEEGECGMGPERRAFIDLQMLSSARKGGHSPPAPGRRQGEEPGLPRS